MNYFKSRSYNWALFVGHISVKNCSKRSVYNYQNESNRYLIRYILENNGFEVMESPDGASGVERA
jgi:hypothetical protein